MPVAAVRSALVTGLVALALLLAVLDVTVGLGLAAWGVGLASGVAVAVTVAGSRTRGAVLGPADLVTLGRSLLACTLAALVTEALVYDTALGVIIPLAVVALLLDAVDGRVARRSGGPRRSRRATRSAPARPAPPPWLAPSSPRCGRPTTRP